MDLTEVVLFSYCLKDFVFAHLLIGMPTSQEHGIPLYPYFALSVECTWRNGHQLREQQVLSLDQLLTNLSLKYGIQKLSIAFLEPVLVMQSLQWTKNSYAAIDKEWHLSLTCNTQDL